MMPPEIVGVKMEPERLFDSVNILLSLQVRIIFLRFSKQHGTFLVFGDDFFKSFSYHQQPPFSKPLQSKNGGLAAWEPAGASEWLEVIYFNMF